MSTKDTTPDVVEITRPELLEKRLPNKVTSIYSNTNRNVRPAALAPTNRHPLNPTWSNPTKRQDCTSGTYLKIPVKISSGNKLSSK